MLLAQDMINKKVAPDKYDHVLLCEVVINNAQWCAIILSFSYKKDHKENTTCSSSHIE